MSEEFDPFADAVNIPEENVAKGNDDLLLPPDWEENTSSFILLEPGIYSITVKSAELKKKNVYFISLEVREDESGATIWDNVPVSENTLFRLKPVVDAFDVHSRSVREIVSKLPGRKARVMVGVGEYTDVSGILKKKNIIESYLPKSS